MLSSSFFFFFLLSLRSSTICFVACRCPAYVDLYARSPKLKGTWTVYLVVTRRRRGGFAFRSEKNLSILPTDVVRFGHEIFRAVYCQEKSVYQNINSTYWAIGEADTMCSSISAELIYFL